MYRKGNKYNLIVSFGGIVCMRVNSVYDKFIITLPFILFFSIACYNLTYSPLGVDEAVEYWFSKIMNGNLPYNIITPSNYNTAWTINDNNMYDRIIWTFQPPLYNVFMYFWLLINDSSEWWYRFSGVFIGFWGLVGLYKTIYITTNKYWASLSVVFMSFLARYIYYVQECAEYILMISSLFWTIYFWVKLLKNGTTKNIISFTIACIIPVYCQYGSAFAILGMGISAFIFIAYNRGYDKLLILVKAYTLATIFAAIPLYVFFIKPQMQHMQEFFIEYSMTEKVFSIHHGYLLDFIYSIKSEVIWLLWSENYHNNIVFAIILSIALVGFWVKYNDSFARYITIGFGMTVVFHYVAVKFGWYANSYYSDGFDTRYSLFLMPMFISIIFIFSSNIFSFIISKYDKKNVRYCSISVLLVMLVAFFNFQWDNHLKNNWIKSYSRDTINAWFDNECYQKTTLVPYLSRMYTAYYIKNNNKYQNNMFNNVHFYGDINFEKMFVDYYKNDVPHEFYLILMYSQLSGVFDDREKIIEFLKKNNYEIDVVYNNGNDSLLYCKK